MKLDIPTLAFILSLTGMTQVIAFFIQFRVNRIHRGIGWWLLGSAFMSLGFISLILGTVETIKIISVIGNPLLILGRICLFIGTVRFVGRKENPWITASAFVGFVLLYYYYMYGNQNISGRTVVVSAAIAAFSFAIAYNLFFNGSKNYSTSAKFTGSIFLAHGIYLMAIVFYSLFSRPIQSYTDFSTAQVAVFIVPIMTSMLWTFGFILMVNQRLSMEVLEEKENLQRIFNTSPDASLITRLEDGLIIDINMGYSVISGYSRSDMLGKSDLDIRFWNSLEDRQRFTSELLERGLCENLEFVFQRKDGSQLVGLISAKTITISGVPHGISVIRDITERKEAEEALRESEETYRSILKASPDDITITDLAGRILLVSPAANTMFGYEEGEGFGHFIQEFIVPEEVERARANIALMHQGGYPGPNEYRGRKKDGSLFDIEVNSGLVRGLRGQPTKMVFVVRDISDRKHAEVERARLEAQNHQLQKAESLSRMAGAIAHHFNNKLQSVMANLEVLDGVSTAAETASRLSLAKQATEGAAAVSRLMLVYLGQASDKREPQFLAAVCRAALALIQGTQAGHPAVQADWPSPGPLVKVNADQVQLVLANLLANAWEAMGEGEGVVRLGLRTCPAEAIPSRQRFPIDWQPQGVDHACLEVADTGQGIARADIEKLFDPFFSTKFSGRGLGLPVVLGIVQAHGGAIVVQSEPGRGSVFQVYIPVATSGRPSLPENRMPVAESVSEGTVLLVDDDECLLTSTAAMIELIGFTVLTAKDGVEAVDVYRQHRGAIQCVITDLTMPRMDGWEVLAALHRLEPDLPVILASGYDKAQVMSGAHPDHPQGFLGKPYNLQQLRDTMAQALAAPGGVPHRGQ